MLELLNKHKNILIAVGVLGVGFLGYKFYRKQTNLKTSSDLAIKQAVL